MVIELRPHIAKAITGPQMVDTGIQQVLADGRRIGWLSNNHGAAAMLHERFDEATLAEIDSQIRKLSPGCGKTIQLSPLPKPIQTANASDF